MAINAREAKGTGGRRQEPMDPGTLPGRLVQIIDLGLQPQEYMGESKPPMREISTTYEFVDEFMKDEDGNDIEDKPRWLSESFVLHNLAADRAKSTARYYALDPNSEHDGDWSELLGSPVMITVVQKKTKKGDIVNNISATSAVRARDIKNIPPLKNDPRFLDLDDPTEESMQMFTDLPQWLRDKITKGLDWKGSIFQIALESFTPKKKEKKAVVEETTDDKDETTNDNGNW